MASRKVKTKRSSFAIIILSPMLVFIGLVGCCMYALGGNHITTRCKPTRPTQKDNVTFLPIPLEEKQEIRIHKSRSNN